MLRRAAHALGVGNGSAKAVEEEAPPTEEALLQRWLDAGGPSAATLAAFAGTSELPAGPQPAAVRALLLRYLRAEKLDAAKAAARLEAQAVWRQGFGAVDEVRVLTGCWGLCCAGASPAAACWPMPCSSGERALLRPPAVQPACRPAHPPALIFCTPARLPTCTRAHLHTTPQAELPTELASGKVKLQAPSARSAWRPLLIVKAARHRAGATPQQVNRFVLPCLVLQLGTRLRTGPPAWKLERHRRAPTLRPQVNRFVAYCLESAAGYCWHPDSADGKIVAAFDLGGEQRRSMIAAVGPRPLQLCMWRPLALDVSMALGGEARAGRWAAAVTRCGAASGSGAAPCRWPRWTSQAGGRRHAQARSPPAPAARPWNPPQAHRCATLMWPRCAPPSTRWPRSPSTGPCRPCRLSPWPQACKCATWTPPRCAPPSTCWPTTSPSACTRCSWSTVRWGGMRGVGWAGWEAGLALPLASAPPLAAARQAALSAAIPAACPLPARPCHCCPPPARSPRHLLLHLEAGGALHRQVRRSLCTTERRRCTLQSAASPALDRACGLRLRLACCCDGGGSGRRRW